MPETPETAPATAALRGVARSSMARTDRATVTRMSMPTRAAIARGENHATTATPTGVNRVRAPSAQPSGRQAMSRIAVRQLQHGQGQRGQEQRAGHEVGREQDDERCGDHAHPEADRRLHDPAGEHRQPEPADQEPVHQGKRDAA